MTENGAHIDASGNLVMGDFTIPGHLLPAARKFFREERDELAGRWRWPEQPNVVVYPHRFTRDIVRVNIEGSGHALEVARSDADNSYGDPYKESAMAAARAYFDAHPVDAPWGNAKWGEIWNLNVGGEEEAYVMSNNGYFQPTKRGDRITPGNLAIRSGDKVWPIEDSRPPRPRPEDLTCTLIDPQSDPVVITGIGGEEVQDRRFKPRPS